MELVLARQSEKQELQTVELKRPLPKGQSGGETRWEIPELNSYESTESQAPQGPNTKAKTIIENGSWESLFFLLFPLSLINTIARQTQQYGIEDWVRPVQSTNQQSSADNTSDEEESSDKVEMEVETDANRPKQARKFTPRKEENLDTRH